MNKSGAFRDLPTKKKIEHIWEYYKFHILAAAFVLFLIILTVSELSAPKPQLDALLLNADAEESAAVGFAEFFSEYGYEYYDGAVALNTTLGFYSEEELSRVEDDAAYRQENSEKELILAAQVAAGNTELLFGTEEHFLFVAEQGLLTDLRTVLSEELLEQYADALIYIDEGGTAESYPCAVALESNSWLAENGYYSGECMFGIMYLADNPEIAADFADFLLKQ